MRSFATVHPQFWTGKTGKELRKAGANAQVLALYLITSPHAHMSGIYYVPKQTIAYETGRRMKDVNEGLSALSKLQFAFYDEASEHVWVKEMLLWQVKEINPDDHRVKGIVKWCNSLPSVSFLSAFYERYASELPGLKPLTSPLHGPPKGQQQEGLRSPNILVPDPAPDLSSSEEGGTGEETSDLKKKLPFGDFGNVKLARHEHGELIKRFGDQGATNRIRDADLYFGSKGNAGKYKSHYLTILAWERKNGTRQQDSSQATRTSRGDFKYTPRQ